MLKSVSRTATRCCWTKRPSHCRPHSLGTGPYRCEAKCLMWAALHCLPCGVCETWFTLGSSVVGFWIHDHAGHTDAVSCHGGLPHSFFFSCRGGVCVQWENVGRDIHAISDWWHRTRKL